MFTYIATTSTCYKRLRTVWFVSHRLFWMNPILNSDIGIRSWVQPEVCDWEWINRNVNILNWNILKRNNFSPKLEKHTTTLYFVFSRSSVCISVLYSAMWRTQSMKTPKRERKMKTKKWIKMLFSQNICLLPWLARPLLCYHFRWTSSAKMSLNSYVQ